MSRTGRTRSANHRKAGRPAAPAAPPGAGWPALPVLAAAFLVAAFAVYARSLDGPFVSDDVHYLANNPYVNGSAPAWHILDPTGEAVTLVENYAPVHLLLHRAVWELFGANVVAHHVVNVLFHVAASLLLVVLLRRTGLRDPWAALGGAVFLLHPANAEAVAWMCQLKSSSSLTLALAALLLLGRRPGLATGLYALSLFAKPTAAFALPVAVLLWWTQRDPALPLARDGALRWLGGWTAVFLAFAAVEFPAFARATSDALPMSPDPVEQGRSIVALAGRYLAMAYTTWGLSAFHEPGPARSWLDGWFLAGLAGMAGLGARALWALRAGRPEAAYWAWAAVSFVPVSQIFPFPFPLADRYLYSILPGLIGGTLLAAQPALARLEAPGRVRPAAVAGAVLLLALGVRAEGRAALYRSPALLQADAARHYPEGVNAHLMRAKRAAAEGRDAVAIAELRGALGRGYDRFEQVFLDPAYRHLHGTPAFQALLAEMAGRWVARLGGQAELSQAELYSLAIAHRLRGERAEGLAAVDRGLALGGPLDANLRAERRRLESLR